MAVVKMSDSNDGILNSQLPRLFHTSSSRQFRDVPPPARDVAKVQSRSATGPTLPRSEQSGELWQEMACDSVFHVSEGYCNFSLSRDDIY